MTFCKKDVKLDQRLKLRPRRGSWIIIPLALFAFFSPVGARAENQTWGLNTQVFTVEPTEQFLVGGNYSICENSWTSVPNINFNFDDYQNNGIVAGCRADRVIVRYYGYIVVPESEEGFRSITFWNLSDDGFYLSINNQTVINNWDWQGCSGRSGTIDLYPGEEYEFEAWYFEDGGQACNYLYWSPDGIGIEIVPPSAFRKEQTPPPTTTTPETTIPETTAPETELPPEETTTTIQEPVSSVPNSTLVEEEKPLPPVESPTNTSTTSTTSTTLPIIIQNTPTTRPLNENRTTTTTTEITIPQPAPDQESEIKKEEILKSILNGEISKEIALQAASNSQILSEISKSEASEIFKSLEVSSLSKEELEKIIEAIQESPTYVRQAFENEINVFGGEFDTYVPTGSSVDVKTRRVIVAATTVLTTIGITVTGGSSGSGSFGGNGSPGSSGGNSGKGRRKQ